jgi:3-phosphoshikimate 1-carboxyvinyltransferase
MKESDRLSAVASMLLSLGGRAEEFDDSLIVRGKPITGGKTDSFGDHRLAMSAAIASCMASFHIIIENPML